ncbi:MAG: KH domain-containing protein [Chloroflexota bacterium]
MKDLVEYIVKALVEYPEQVSIHETVSASLVSLELSVADSDVGRIIGKGGRVVNSIRTLLQVSAAKQGKRATLELAEE